MSFFIVLEGIDGAGKSTQAFLLEKYFKSKNRKVFVTREPTDGIVGGIIRAALNKKLKLSQRTMQILFSADRSEHEEEIKARLKANYVVICDRYFYSTIAYGMVELNKDWLIQLNSQFLQPHVTILLDVPAEIALRRVNKRFSKTIFEKINYLEKVRKNFLELKKNFKNYYIVDGTKSIQEVNEKILKIIKKKLKI